MPRITDAGALALLENNRYEVYDLVTVAIAGLAAPFTDGILLTNYPTDLVIDGKTYISLGGFMGISPYAHSSQLQVNGMTIVLSGLPARDNNDDSFLQLFLDEEWKDRSVIIDKVLVDDPTDPSTIFTVTVFKGFTINSNFSLDDGGAGTISVSIGDEFAAFESKGGRRNNPSEAPEIATKLYKDWPKNPVYQLLPTFNDFSAWPLVGMGTLNTGLDSYFYSPYGTRDSSSVSETAVTSTHVMNTPVIGSILSGEPITMSFFIADYGDGGSSRRFMDVSVTSNETGTTNGPIFDLNNRVVDTVGGGNYTSYGIYGATSHIISTENTHPGYNKAWQFVYVTFTPGQDMTDVQFKLFSMNSNTSYLYLGNVDFGYQICNASVYNGEFDYDFSVKLPRYYHYIPDKLFKNSAATNLRINWIDA